MSTKIRMPWLPLLCALALLLSGCRAGGAVTPPPSQREEVEAARDASPRSQAAAFGSATVMVYMIGSDLESEAGLGTLDLEEMARADLGDRVHLVIQTMGCRQWHNEAVSASAAQRFTVEGGELVCQQPDLGQLDSTDPATLGDFIAYCAARYPADRNILVFWDHGAGPVYGFGYDEFRPTGTLTLDELQSALALGGVRFDLIGFDACLMGCLETCCALQDYADYLICSEDFVSGYGWEYQYWLTELGDDVSIPTEALGRTIVDTYVTESEQAGDPGVLALVDLDNLPALFAAWTEFAYANREALTAVNYSWPTHITRRDALVEQAEGADTGAVMEDYYITDLMALASTLDCPERRALALALHDAVAYSASDGADRAYSGLAVTLPYGNPDFYASLSEVYTRCGFDPAYVRFLGCFADAAGAEHFYEHWSDWAARWDNSSPFGGWFAFEYGSAWSCARAPAPRAG